MTDLQQCQLCARLSSYRRTLKQRYPDYHCAPVAAFGAAGARLLVVGLAPGLHGANASGRPFTGDASGDLLFAALHRHGFATRPTSRSRDDNTGLLDCRITNAVKCVPLQNRPLAAEVNNCNSYLGSEIDALPGGGVLLALGGIAHRAVVRALALRQAAYPFRHAAEYELEQGRRLVACIHPSRYNVNTGRIDAAALSAVFARIRALLP